MIISNSYSRYGSVTKFFHWTIAILVICMLIFGLCLDLIPKDMKPVAYNTHKLTGLFILCLTSFAVIWAIINKKPTFPSEMSRSQRIAARIMHFSLFAIVMAMPIVGLIGSSAVGKYPHIGSFQIGFNMEQNKELSETMFNIHGTLGFILIALVILHMGAAIYHHLIKHDNILLRMLPDRK